MAQLYNTPNFMANMAHANIIVIEPKIKIDKIIKLKSRQKLQL